MKKIAVFDLDNTLFDGVSVVTFLFGYIIPQRKISLRALFKALILIAAYKLRFISHNKASQLTMEVSAKVLKGKGVSEVEMWKKNFFRKKHFHSYVPQLFSILKKHGFTIVIVSASIQPIVEACADIFDVAAVGSTVTVKDGKFTGQVAQLVNADEKANVLQKFRSADSTVLVFGDSTGDLAMLKKADTAFVFEPRETELGAVATKLGMIVVDRTSIVSEVMKVL